MVPNRSSDTIDGGGARWGNGDFWNDNLKSGIMVEGESEYF